MAPQALEPSDGWRTVVDAGLHAAALRLTTTFDGMLEDMIPWLLTAGMDGIYPLERQSGVDVARIRKNYPRLLMMGGYDKMVMNKGEVAMRAEFERLLPVMRTGGFIPSVDHQTPPGVSLENYRIYTRLFGEYAARACDRGVSSAPFTQPDYFRKSRATPAKASREPATA
jgi:hypothetical protein